MSKKSTPVNVSEKTEEEKKDLSVNEPVEEKPEEKKQEKEKKKPLTKAERKAARAEKKKNNKNRPKNVKASTKRLLSYLRPYKGRLIFVMIIVIVSTVAGASVLGIVGPVLNTLNDAVIQKIPAEKAMQKIIGLLSIMIGVTVLSGIISMVYSKIMLNISQKTMNGLRRDLFNHIQNLPLQFFDTTKTGEIMSRYNTDVEAVSSLINDGFINLIKAALDLIVYLVLMLSYSWRITLCLMGSIVAVFVIIAVISSVSSKLFKKQHKIMGEYNGYSEEYIRGQRVVKSFNHEKLAKQGFRDITENYKKTSVKANIVSGLMAPLITLVSKFNYVVSIGFGSSLVKKKEMTAENLMSFIQYATQFSSPLATIAGQYTSLMAALAGAERVFEVLDMKHEIDEGTVTLVNVQAEMDGTWKECEERTGYWAWKVPDADTFFLVPVKGDIRFEEVDFSYKEGETVLKQISLEAKSGQKLAFVGSTGAGKTTITNLINRFYDIENGMITYDGIPIKNIKKADLRRSLAMVLQDTRLFVGTVEENIRYGRLDATHEDVVAAAKTANAHSFIEKLPDGYNTELTTDGQNLSAGQRQLLSIARAAIADAPVLILDEATSSVDTRTERLIEVGMDSIMEGRTVFVIAHRLSTVRNSDNIIVLEKGEIIEEGNHKALLDQQGKYYQLYTGQFKLS